MKGKNTILISGVMLVSLTSILEDMVFIRGNRISKTEICRLGALLGEE